MLFQRMEILITKFCPVENVFYKHLHTYIQIPILSRLGQKISSEVFWEKPVTKILENFIIQKIVKSRIEMDDFIATSGNILPQYKLSIDLFSCGRRPECTPRSITNCIFPYLHISKN